VPDEIVDVSLCERFGWTWTELDEQDMSRVLPAVGAANIGAACTRITHWLTAAGAGKKGAEPTPHDWQLWKFAQDAVKEIAK
jgi:hypothetical protein